MLWLTRNWVHSGTQSYSALKEKKCKRFYFSQAEFNYFHWLHHERETRICNRLEGSTFKQLIFEIIPLRIGLNFEKATVFRFNMDPGQGRTQGDAQDAGASPPLPLCIPPPTLCIPPLAMCIPPPPQPERLVMRKDEAVGNKKKMQVCLELLNTVWMWENRSEALKEYTYV